MQTQLYGQTTVVKEYVNENFYPADQGKAKYYRVANKDSNKKLTGKAQYYFLPANDSVRKLYARGEYTNNNQISKWEWWYANGQPKEIGYYAQVSYNDNNYPNIDYKIENFWASTGTQLITKGTGSVVYYHDKVLVREGTYVDGQNMAYGMIISKMVSSRQKKHLSMVFLKNVLATKKVESHLPISYRKFSLCQKVGCLDL
jgi:hypothetical protein